MRSSSWLFLAANSSSERMPRRRRSSSSMRRSRISKGRAPAAGVVELELEVGALDVVGVRDVPAGSVAEPPTPKGGVSCSSSGGLWGRSS